MDQPETDQEIPPGLQTFLEEDLDDSQREHFLEHWEEASSEGAFTGDQEERWIGTTTLGYFAILGTWLFVWGSSQFNLWGASLPEWSTWVTAFALLLVLVWGHGEGAFQTVSEQVPVSFGGN